MTEILLAEQGGAQPQRRRDKTVHRVEAAGGKGQASRQNSRNDQRRRPDEQQQGQQHLQPGSDGCQAVQYGIPSAAQRVERRSGRHGKQDKKRNEHEIHPLYSSPSAIRDRSAMTGPEQTPRARFSTVNNTMGTSIRQSASRTDGPEVSVSA